MQEQDGVVLYRKGRPNGNMRGWFTSISEAVHYDGKVSDENIYFFTVSGIEFKDKFEGNGCGYTLRENLRGDWEAIKLRIRRLPPNLVELVEASVS